MQMHNCQHCGQDLPVSAFWKNKSKPYGLDIWCKDCYKSLPSYTARLERSRQGYRPPSARNEVRRAKDKARRERSNAR